MVVSITLHNPLYISSADQDLSPLKKRLCGEVELNRHSIHSVDVQATAPSTST